MKRVLVTGGGGFLGSHVIEDLHAAGVVEIIVLDTVQEVRNIKLEEDRVRFKSYVKEWIVGSILDAATLQKAVKGCDAVFHVASIVDFGTLDRKVIFDVNVTGTEMVVAACQNEPSVRALVYSSSLDVVVVNSDFTGIDGKTEADCPYASSIADMSHDYYAITKTQAEQTVLAANQTVRHLRTAACRPVGIYGERDMMHIGNVLKVARDAGKLNLFKFGDGSAVFQHVYARNCAHLHVLVASKLVAGDDNVAGEAFFATDGTLVNNFFTFFEPYLAAKKYQIPRYGIPLIIAYPLACLCEDAFNLIRRLAPSLVKGVQFVFTRRAVHDTCVNTWFNSTKAQKLVGYKPVFTPIQARERGIKYFDTQTELFPVGNMEHPAKIYDYADDGTDFTPKEAKYLQARGNRNDHPNERASKYVLLLGLAYLTMKYLKSTG